MLTFFWECLFYFGYWFFKLQIFFESLLLDIVFVFKISSFVFLYVFTCDITCFIWIFYGFRKNLFSCGYFQKHVLFPFVISSWFYKIYLVLQEVWNFTYLYYYEYSDFKSFELFRPFFLSFLSMCILQVEECLWIIWNSCFYVELLKLIIRLLWSNIKSGFCFLWVKLRKWSIANGCFCKLRNF